MPNLRQIIDGASAQPLPGKSDVFKHLADVKKKQADTDVAKAKLHTNLAPVKNLIQMVEQLHPLNPPMPTTDLSGNPLPGAMLQQQNNQLQQNGDDKQNGKGSKEELFNKDSQQNPGESDEDKPVTKKKSSGKSKSKKSKSKKVDNGKGLSVHIKAKSKKKRFDYHDNPGLSLQPGRNIGLSGASDIRTYMTQKSETLKAKVKGAAFPTNNVRTVTPARPTSTSNTKMGNIRMGKSK